MEIGEAHDGGREGEKERERERVGHARAELTVSLSDVRGSAGKRGVMIPIRRLQIGRKRGLAEAGDKAEGGGGAGEAKRHHVRHATRDIDCKRSRLGGVMSADAERQDEDDDDEEEQEQGRCRNGEGEEMAQIKGFSFLLPKWWSFS